jgi:hypothetical protein
MLRDALITGSIACVATLAAAALLGKRERGSAVAPINATSHILWGEEDAARARVPDIKHTVPGVALNEGACVFWAAFYEKAFGHRAERGDVAAAVAGGGAIAALAYLVDYHLVSKRLTPGWELQLSGRSLAVMYAALALSFPLRGLMRRRRNALTAPR